jgi:hypothetical protein
MLEAPIQIYHFPVLFSDYPRRAVFGCVSIISYGFIAQDFNTLNVISHPSLTAF